MYLQAKNLKIHKDILYFSKFSVDIFKGNSLNQN